MTHLPRARARAALALATTVTVLSVAGTSPAHAGLGTGGASTGGGYGVGASQVTVTGDVDASLQASVPSPPPLCYWKPLDFAGVDPSDMQAVSDYYWEKIHSPSSTQAAYYYAFGEDGFAQAIKAAKNGADLTWYELVVDEKQAPSGGDYYQQSRALSRLGCGEGTNRGSLVSYAAFEPGQVPEPVVDPEILAQYAYEVMDLVEPTLQWNPQLDDLGQASLVNLDTWFWVDDPEAVGERSVTATAGAVSATVTATTGGVSITSPAGTTQCSPEEARTSYRPGVATSSACTLTFSRASHGYPRGFPMAASTDWEATWTSNTGEGGDLDGRTAAQTTYVPVAESQSVVESTG